jgi:hypothetical protein
MMWVIISVHCRTLCLLVFVAIKIFLTSPLTDKQLCQKTNETSITVAYRHALRIDSGSTFNVIILSEDFLDRRRQKETHPVILT